MILVFDTSTAHLSIGLASDEGELLHEYHATATAEERGIHDARLALECSNLFLAAGISPSEIQRIGLIIGPGSFTGLRIGLTFAKGLAFANQASVIPLTPHEVMAREVGQAECAIVTPGYRPDLFYVSTSAAPKNIRLTGLDDLAGVSGKKILAHDSLQGYFDPVFEDCLFGSPSLSTMAILTVDSDEPIANLSLDSLEPLYLTEFTVTKAQK